MATMDKMPPSYCNEGLLDLRHTTHTASNKPLLLHLADYLEEADIMVLLVTSKSLQRALPEYATISRHAPLLERLKFITALARSMPNHYACDCCFALHPIADARALRKILPPPYIKDAPPYASRAYYVWSKFTQRVKDTAGKAKKAFHIRTLDERLSDTAQTHRVMANVLEPPLVPRATRDENVRLSAVRPPCMRHSPVRHFRWCDTDPRRIVCFLHERVHVGNSCRHTPLAGIMHQHVQMALKHHRLRPRPRRALAPYMGYSTTYDRNLISVPMTYFFAPKIVDVDGTDMFLLKTVFHTSSATPVSFCPHQTVNQASSPGLCALHRPAAHDARDGGVQDGTLFTYRLKDQQPRQPGTIGCVLQDLLRTHYTRMPHPDDFCSPSHRSVAPLEAHLSCPHCPTDIRIRCDALVEYTVWQNFGAEGSSLDPVWQSHLVGAFLQGEEGYDDARTLACMDPGDELEPWQRNTHEHGPSVTATPGAIRDLYRRG